jgi:hypothetical protein
MVPTDEQGLVYDFEGGDADQTPKALKRTRTITSAGLNRGTLRLAICEPVFARLRPSWSLTRGLRANRVELPVQDPSLALKLIFDRATLYSS